MLLPSPRVETILPRVSSDPGLVALSEGLLWPIPDPLAFLAPPVPSVRFTITTAFGELEKMECEKDLTTARYRLFQVEVLGSIGCAWKGLSLSSRSRRA